MMDYRDKDLQYKMIFLKYMIGDKSGVKDLYFETGFQVNINVLNIEPHNPATVIINEFAFYLFWYC